VRNPSRVSSISVEALEYLHNTMVNAPHPLNTQLKWYSRVLGRFGTSHLLHVNIWTADALACEPVGSSYHYYLRSKVSTKLGLPVNYFLSLKQMAPRPTFSDDDIDDASSASR